MNIKQTLAVAFLSMAAVACSSSETESTVAQLANGQALIF